METRMSTSKIGRYEITGELGKGAMGVVYKAIDPMIGRTVALKTMRLDVRGLETDEMLRRFKNEARLAGVLNHPNIVTIFDAGEHEAMFYIAMEYVEGVSLHSILQKRKTLPLDEIQDVVRQICAGLDHAHKHGVIHRDVKPANIMITANGTVKIMDFGIAKSGSGDTSTGQVMGTPNYMAPEQIKGHPLDGRSDLFSLGVILYEMVAGQKPFASDNVTSIIYKIVNEPPVPPRTVDPNIGQGLSDVVVKALAKNPTLRYQSGADLIAALDPKHEGKGMTAVPEPPADLPRPSPWTLSQLGVKPPDAAAEDAQRLRRREGQVTAPGTAAQLKEQLKKTAAVAPPPKTNNLKLVVVGLTAAVAILLAMAYSFSHKGPSLSVDVTPIPAVSQPETIESPAPPISGSVNPSPVSKPPSGKPAPAAPAASAKPPATTTKTGAIQITSIPVGATVKIDGKADPTYITPFTAANVTPGPHTLEFSRQGFAAAKNSVTVSAGKTAIVATKLQSAGSVLAISSDPKGAQIYLDGHDTGHTTPSEITTSAGFHQVVLRKQGFDDATVTGTAGEDPLTLFGSLRPSGSATTTDQPKSSNPFTKLKKLFGGKKETVAVQVKSTPPGASITVDGNEIAGETPITLQLAPGEYDIGLTESGFATAHRKITVEKGSAMELNLTLQKK
jgi:eukaryotic-like serine/threonine-protein kinase